MIGLSGEPGYGSLKDLGVRSPRQVELKDGQGLTFRAFWMRSRRTRSWCCCSAAAAIDWRPSLSVGELNAAISAIHAARPARYPARMVDNCYGEFTDSAEPAADLMAGSLIKNPGGGLAP